MDWAEIGGPTGLTALIGGLVSLPCDWAGQPRRQHTSARIELDVLGGRGIGIDDRGWANVSEVPSGGGSAEVTGVRARVEGVRELTLQIQVWSPTQTLATTARRYLGEIRTRLRLPSTLAALKAFGLAIVTLEDVVPLDPPEDGRRVSRAAMDVRLAYTAFANDEPVPFIETARVRSDVLRHPGGDPLPFQQDTHPPPPPAPEPEP